MIDLYELPSQNFLNALSGGRQHQLVITSVFVPSLATLVTSIRLLIRYLACRTEKGNLVHLFVCLGEDYKDAYLSLVKARRAGFSMVFSYWLTIEEEIKKSVPLVLLSLFLSLAISTDVSHGSFCLRLLF
jgi:hypothetical protein